MPSILPSTAHPLPTGPRPSRISISSIRYWRQLGTYLFLKSKQKRCISDWIPRLPVFILCLLAGVWLKVWCCREVCLSLGMLLEIQGTCAEGRAQKQHYIIPLVLVVTLLPLMRFQAPLHFHLLAVSGKRNK